MKDYVSKLLSRPRHGEPTKEDWDNILALFTTAFTRQRDSSLYATTKLTRKISGTLETLIDALDVVLGKMDDLVRRPYKASAADLAAAARSLHALSLSGVTTSSTANTNLSKFLAKSGAYMASLQDGVGDTSEEEARAGIKAQLPGILEQNTLLFELLDLFTGAMANYAATTFPATGVAKTAQRGLRYLKKIEDGPEGLLETLSRLSAIRATLQEQTNPIIPQEIVYSGTGVSYDFGGDLEGEEAAITASLSGPYAYAAPATLNVTADGVGPHLVNLTPAQQAFLMTSQAQTVPPPPGGPAWLIGPDVVPTYTQIRFQVSINGGPTTWVTTDLNHEMVPANAWLLVQAAGLIAGLKEGWDTSGLPIVTVVGGAGDYLELTTLRYGEDASIAIIGNFQAWDSGGLPPAWVGVETIGGWPDSNGIMSLLHYPPNVPARGSWRSARQIVEETKNQSPALPSYAKDEVAGGDYGIVTGSQTITLRKMNSGGVPDLTVTAGSAVVSSALYNFEACGVEAGDKIMINHAEELTVAGVDGQTATLTSAPTIAAGVYVFTAYPDLSAVAAGYLLDTDFGPFKVAGIGAEGLVNIATYTDYPAPVLPQDTYFSLTEEFYKVSSPTQTTGSSITVGATAAAAVMGLAGTSRGDVYGWEDRVSGAYSSLAAQPVREDDKLVCSVTRLIQEGGARLLLKTALPNNLSEAFTIRNSDYQEWEALSATVAAWRAANLDQITGLVATVSRMLSAARIQPTAIAQAKAAANAAIATLAALTADVDAYGVRDLPDIELIFALLRNRSLDRASRLLETCDFAAFFALGSDELTFGDYFAKKSRETVRTLANMSRYDDASLEELIESGITYPNAERFGVQK